MSEPSSSSAESRLTRQRRARAHSPETFNRVRGVWRPVFFSLLVVARRTRARTRRNKISGRAGRRARQTETNRRQQKQTPRRCVLIRRSCCILSDAHATGVLGCRATGLSLSLSHHRGDVLTGQHRALLLVVLCKSSFFFLLSFCDWFRPDL